LERIGKAEKKSCGIAKRSNPMVQTSVEMCQEEQRALWRRMVEYVVIVAAGLFFAILVTALVPSLGSTAHAAAVVQPTGMVGSTGGNVAQPTGMVGSTDENAVQSTGMVDPQDSSSVQSTGMVDPQDPNIVQSTGMVDPQDPNIVQPTGIVGPADENVVQPTEMGGHHGIFISLTGNVGRNGDLIQTTDVVGRDGNLVQPIASVGPKAKHVMQEMLIAQSRNGKIIQVVINIFHVSHHE
jgi:hypothetical protein